MSLSKSNVYAIVSALLSGEPVVQILYRDRDNGWRSSSTTIKTIVIRTKESLDKVNSDTTAFNRRSIASHTALRKGDVYIDHRDALAQLSVRVLHRDSSHAKDRNSCSSEITCPIGLTGIWFAILYQNWLADFCEAKNNRGI